MQVRIPAKNSDFEESHIVENRAFFPRKNNDFGQINIDKIIGVNKVFNDWPANQNVLRST